jgi:aryl-alcohol dehydrogenase-like predicted oxidoreductase
MKRREFLEVVGAAPLAASLLALRAGGTEDTVRGDMRYRKLGSTGVEVSIIGLGGHHIGRPSDEAEGIKIIRAGIDAGINFMDNCWDYHDGGSEIRMGKALRDGYRDRVVLMTKIDGRTKKKAAEQIDECLKRLQTDRIDLMQHHEIIRLEDPDRVFAEGGAMEACLDARNAGKIRFIGFTGHKDPIVHLRMLEIAAKHDFHFDSAQMPLNVLDAHFRSFARNVVPVLVREGIAVLGMKPMADGAIPKSRVVSAAECLRYAMSLPTSVVITGMESLDVLKQNLEVVRAFAPLSQDEMAALLAKTAAAAAEGHHERFKTSSAFDGTAMHPEWLG